MNGKHFYSLDDYYRKKFGCKVIKISLDIGLNCPNRDGTKGYGGCIFCNGVPGIGNSKEDIKTQFNNVKNLLKRKWPNAKYIAFFENNTNTYASLEKLKSIYEEVLSYPDVVGISIATRCDSISSDLMDYLAILSKKTFISIELGLQSSHDETLKWCNRGHSVLEFTDCVTRLKKYNIEVVAHIINGLPNETEKMMLETIDYLNELKVDGIKFHMLYIEEGTRLASLYLENPFNLLSREEYIRILGKQILRLDKKIVVHRLISGPDNKKLIEPQWLKGKFLNLNAINDYFVKNDIYQGAKKKN